MYQKKSVFLIALIVSIFVCGKAAIGAMEGMRENHMIEHMLENSMPGMPDESCAKEPGMMMPNMGGPMMKDGMGMHKMGEPMMHKGMDMPMMNPWEYLKERFNLTDEQAAKLGKIYSDYRKEVLRKKTDIEIAEMELGELLETKGSDESAIEDSVNKLESLRSNLSLYRIKSFLKTREFLSDEQYEGLAGYFLRWGGPYRMKGMQHGGMEGMMGGMGMMECR